MKKHILATAVSFVTSGCGGDIEIKAEEPISIDQVIEVNELSISEVSFSSTVKDISLEVLSTVPENAGNLSLSGNKIGIQTNDVDRPGHIKAVLFISSKGSDHASSKDLNVLIQNVSAKELETETESVLSSKNEILTLAEDHLIYKFILDVAYLNKLINYQEREDKTAEFDARSSSQFSSANSRIEMLDEVYAEYTKGRKSDVDLESQLMTTLSSIQDHGTFGNDKILDIKQFYDPFLPDFSHYPLSYYPESNGISKYIGNPAIGHYQSGSWVFDQDHDLFNELLK